MIADVCQAIDKGHSQLVHMRVRYHFLANLHITLHHKIRARNRKCEAQPLGNLNEPRRVEVFASQNSDYISFVILEQSFSFIYHG